MNFACDLIFKTDALHWLPQPELPLHNCTKLCKLPCCEVDLELSEASNC